MTFQKKLIAWFKSAQRDLPWRHGYEAYQVWISEIMLQQTQVSTVLPYFERWMQALPTVESVARAEEDVILKLWEGLGYYSRAQNLQKAARILVQDHGGKLPNDFEALLALPGIGPYTAGAISSIAFEQDETVVDGNVVRVLARLDGFEKNTRENMKYFWQRAEQVLPEGQARNFNQGLMELGALICTPTKPLCSKCPLSEDCIALRDGKVNVIPVMGARPKSTALKVVVAVIFKDGKVFIQKRSRKGLMAGLWEFPGGEVEAGETLEAALKREIREELDLNITNIRPFMEIKHAYTRFKVHLHCFLADHARGNFVLNAAEEGKWVDIEELRDYPFPAANLKIIERLTAGGKAL